MADQDRRRRLAEYVIDRRVELGMRDRRALERRTRELGVALSDRTIGKIELAVRVGASTLSRLDIALDWEPGSSQRTLDGGIPVPKGTRDWDRLANFAKARRVELGMRTLGDLARHSREAGAPLTVATAGVIEQGEPASPANLASLEIVLGWEPGSAGTILVGGEPRRARRDPDYADPADQRIYDAVAPDDRLTEEQRQGIVYFARLMRDAAARDRAG